MPVGHISPSGIGTRLANAISNVQTLGMADRAVAYSFMQLTSRKLHLSDDTVNSLFDMFKLPEDFRSLQAEDEEEEEKQDDDQDSDHDERDQGEDGDTTDSGGEGLGDSGEHGESTEEQSPSDQGNTENPSDSGHRDSEPSPSEPESTPRGERRVHTRPSRS